MAQAANIILADALATPVNHTFAVTSISQNETLFEDRISGTPIGFGKIKVGIKAPSTSGKVGNRNYVAVLQVAVPVLETLGNNSAGLTPPPTVAYTVRATLTIDIPERSTLQQRKDIRKYTEKLLADPQVIALVENLERLF
jgi:hypothetical protein